MNILIEIAELNCVDCVETINFYRSRAKLYRSPNKLYDVNGKKKPRTAGGMEMATFNSHERKHLERKLDSMKFDEAVAYGRNGLKIGNIKNVNSGVYLVSTNDMKNAEFEESQTAMRFMDGRALAITGDSVDHWTVF